MNSINLSTKFNLRSIIYTKELNLFSRKYFIINNSLLLYLGYIIKVVFNYNIKNNLNNNYKFPIII